MRLMFDGFLTPLIEAARKGNGMNTALSQLRQHSFGALLKVEREKQGLSHRDIAVRTGVDREVVKKWEKDEVVPNRFELKKLFGSMQRLRHFVHLLPASTQHQVSADLVAAGEEMPKQYAAIAEAPEPPPKTFAEGLRRARISEGLAQDELGELLNVTGQAVGAWENETNTPIRDHYKAVCELFPQLRTLPEPVLRDIPKPNGGIGQEKPREQNPTPEEPMNNRSPMSTRAPVQPPPSAPQSPPSLKNALIRWGRLVHALKSHEDIDIFTNFLAEANDAGMTLPEVMAALDDPR